MNRYPHLVDLAIILMVPIVLCIPYSFFPVTTWITALVLFLVIVVVLRNKDRKRNENK